MNRKDRRRAEAQQRVQKTRTLVVCHGTVTVTVNGDTAEYGETARALIRVWVNDGQAAANLVVAHIRDAFGDEFVNGVVAEMLRLSVDEAWPVAEDSRS